MYADHQRQQRFIVIVSHHYNRKPSTNRQQLYLHWIRHMCAKQWFVPASFAITNNIYVYMLYHNSKRLHKYQHQ